MTDDEYDFCIIDEEELVNRYKLQIASLKLDRCKLQQEIEKLKHDLIQSKQFNENHSIGDKLKFALRDKNILITELNRSQFQINKLKSDLSDSQNKLKTTESHLNHIKTEIERKSKSKRH